MVAQVLRFGAVGGVATLSHVLIAILAERALAAGPQMANLTGYAAAVLVSYSGHALVTFQAPLQSASRFAMFFVVSLLGLAASGLTVWVIVDLLGQPFVVAMCFAAVLVPAATFLAMRFWVFEREKRVANSAWQGIAISAAVVAVASAIFAGRPLTSDVEWYLVATRAWLGGADLYGTIMEVNPPLNFYFTVPAIFLADCLGIGDADAQYLLVWLVLFAILCWCSAIIRTSFGLSPQRQATLLLGVAVAIIVPSLESIAQREFYLVVLMMPWLMGQVPVQGPPLRREILTAAVAAFGVCLKPYFVLVPIAVTLARCARDRSLRPILAPSNLVFLVIGLAYLGFVAVVHPIYLDEIVPIARLVYGGYSAEPDVALGIVLHEALLLALPVLMAVMDRQGRSNPHPFTAATLAGLLIYLTQAKGFSYHLIPLTSFGLVACVLIMLHSRKIGTFAVGSAVTFAGLIGLSLSEGFHFNSSANQILRLAQERGDFDSVMVLTTGLSAGPPVAFETGAEWVSRYPTNWLVPGAINRLAKTDCLQDPALCARLQEIADRNRSDNIADIITGRPELLVVDLNSNYFDMPHFDWLAFMAEDPDWTAIFDQYRYEGQTERYVLFFRSPDKKTPP
jgi:putative flippase GtrA